MFRRAKRFIHINHTFSHYEKGFDKVRHKRDDENTQEFDDRRERLEDNKEFVLEPASYS